MSSSQGACGRRVIRSVVEGLEFRRLFATFTVINTADSGAGSLRDAIDLANADATADTINFNIPGSGVQRIQPTTNLPVIVHPVAIDGYSQPGSNANTLAVGSDARLLIELNGDLLPDDPNSDGLAFGETVIFMDSGSVFVSADGSSVRGLVINGNFRDKISIAAGVAEMAVTVAGNFIGTNAAGTASVLNPSLGASSNGVLISGGLAVGSRIGGPAPADRNVFGLVGFNIRLDGNSSRTVVRNNYIGLDASGTKALFNFDGVVIDNSTFNVIGGATAADRNVIFGTSAVTIQDEAAAFNRIAGNYIGTAADGVTRPAGNLSMVVGVSVGFDPRQNFVGGNTPAEGNVIAFASSGVRIADADGTPIRHNSIFNCDYPIYLAADSTFAPILANDNDDLDGGGNNGQNFAAILSAQKTAAGTRVNAFLNSNSGRGYFVDFYASPGGGDPLVGEARTFLGTVNVTTDDNGNVSFTADLPAVPDGWVVTNVVTSLATVPFGDSSPISPPQAVTAAVTPPTPPAPLPTLSVNDVSVTEGNSGTKTLTFTVKLSAAATTAVSVLYATQDGTAKTSDNDYSAKNGTLNFAAGETSKTVSVTIKGDTKAEIDESFKLLLSGATGATIADGSAVGTIKNDDAAPAKPKLSVGGFTATEGHGGTKAFTFKVTLDKSSTSAITVKYGTQDDSAKAGTDYTSVGGTLTFAAGETVKTVTVYVKGDTAKETDEKFFLLLSSPTNATIAVAKGTGLIKNDD